MDYARPDAVVSTDWLAARLDAPDIRLVDGSFYLPAQKRDPKAEFVQQPGATYPEQVAHRHPHAFLGEHGVDLGLQAAAQRHQLGPVADQLAQLPDRRRSQPGLREPVHA